MLLVKANAFKAGGQAIAIYLQEKEKATNISLLLQHYTIRAMTTTIMHYNIGLN